MSRTFSRNFSPVSNRLAQEEEFDQSKASPLEEILAPLFAAARDSSSLVAGRLPTEMADAPYEFLKFLLLGQRGGGRPIRLGLFAGSLETVRVLAQLFLQLKSGRQLTRDYAFFGYPVIHPAELAPDAAPNFGSRSARGSIPAKEEYFLGQLKNWRFDGLLSLSTDPDARGFYAVVRSELIAAEVMRPALAAAAAALPLATQAVKVYARDRSSRVANLSSYGWLAVPASLRPSPFEIELRFPREPITGQHMDGLFVVLAEILRLYRAFIAHGQDL